MINVLTLILIDDVRQRIQEGQHRVAMHSKLRVSLGVCRRRLAEMYKCIVDSGH